MIKQLCESTNFPAVADMCNFAGTPSVHIFLDALTSPEEYLVRCKYKGLVLEMK